ncbi:cyanophycinase [Parapedobacter deserti]|uniref:Cyanophycinase n=1 Tax=Parapedobacter deserti TaxID=1912957 RepID=A0ABV7JP14_9SPHI
MCTLKTNRAIYAAVLAVALLLSLMARGVESTPPRGTLFIIGGGARPLSLVRSMVATAPLSSGRPVVVLTMASEVPRESFEGISEQLQQVSDAPIYHLHFSEPAAPSDPRLDTLLQAGLIYMTGGDQNRLMEAIGSGPVYRTIHQAYRQGATIAGTSAGAAVMCQHMITGQQLLGDTAYQATFDKVWHGNIEFAPGLGLIKGVIIDQHFIKRSRYNRLISALAAYPDHTCVGIDESTALVIQPHGVTVAGIGQVVVMSAPKRIGADGALITAEHIQLSLYAAGAEFSL